jgi:hypothetical protein
MNLAPVLTAKNSGGLFELDANGTVVYSRLRKNKDSFEPVPSVVGYNFFDEVAPFENVEDFRKRFRYFIRGSASIENFNFNFRFEENHVPMRVMLVRVSENGQSENTKLVIVDIRNI